VMSNFVVAFSLVMYLGTGDARRAIDTNLQFYNVDDCNYFASRLAKRYGNYSHIDFIDPRDRVTIYCIPKAYDPTLVEIF